MPDASIGRSVPRRGARRRFWFALAASAVPTVATVAILTALLLPNLDSVLRGEVADGTRDFVIGAKTSTASEPQRGTGTATLTPEPGWFVQPTEGEGLLMRSPDRELEVELGAVSPVEAERALADAGEGSPVREEVLVSGIEVRHVEVEQGIVAVLDPGGRAVLVRASTDPPAEFARYRETVARLLETLVAGEDGSADPPSDGE